MASTGDEQPKLRMAPRESADDLTRRLERERRAAQQQREGALDGSLKPYRVGSVPYLNAVPLTRGLEQEILFAPPSRLGEMLAHDELDAALLSVSAVLLCDRYDILDGIAIASLGEVRSVVVGHTRPLEEITEVFCDTASLTSVNLLRVLLAERGLKPAFKPLPSYEAARSAEAVLLIGDPAIEFVRSSPPHTIWDLGEAWYTMTQLPFVYAVWAVRHGISNPRLCQLLREARDFGMDTLDNIIASREEFDLDFRKDYLGWHIHYHLGSDERRGIQRFLELMDKHGLGPVFPPRYIS
jgi:chorismate dehydratase